MRNSAGFELDELPYKATSLQFLLKDELYKVDSTDGVFYGYATVKDGKCIKWETECLKADFRFFKHSDSADVWCELSEDNPVIKDLENMAMDGFESLYSGGKIA